MKKIAILGHWHTGTSLLAHQLRECGMEVGNTATLWAEKYDARCEHGFLNGIGDRLLLGKISSEEALDNIQTVLESYQIEAKKNGWKCYGVKITHALQEGAWDVFKKAFDSRWGEDVLYLVTVRHPFGIIKSTASNENWSPRQIYSSIMSCQRAMEDLLSNRNIIIIGYPNTWITGGIKILVESNLDLTWTKKAMEMFNPDRQRSFTESELVDLSGIYPIPRMGRLPEGEENATVH